jgi:hypothetical protein
VAGITGRVLSFDGVNDYVTLPDKNIAGGLFAASGRSFSVSARFNAIAGSSTIIARASSTSVNRTFQLFVDASNNLITWIRGVQTTISAVSLSTSYHVSVTFDGTTAKAYLNGLYVKDLIIGTAVEEENQEIQIGARTNPSRAIFFTGTIDDPRIYNRALSQAEITSLYNREPFASEMMGLVGWWKLDRDYHVNTAAIIGHNIKSGTTVKIQANNSDLWDDPELSETFTYVASDATILRFLDEVKVYKYWRFSFTGQASVQAGRLWLGEYLQVNPSSLLDLTVSKKRSDVVVYGRDRQKFANPGVGWRRVSAKFPKTNPNMIYRLEQFHDHVGNHSSFIFCNFDTSREFPLVEPLYGSLSDDLSFNHTDRQKYNYSLTIEEDK